MQQRKRLSTKQLLEIIQYFAVDIEATKTAKLTALNRNTVNKYYQLFRKEIYSHSPRNFYLINTTCEIDESYFGPKRFHKDGIFQGLKKIIVFGIIERNGNVFTEIVPNIKTKTLYKIISKHIDTSTIIYSDECSSYNYLKVKRYHHETVIHSKREFVKGSVNTNSIESFWSFCKRRFNKFNGINRNNFHLHLRECEFRFNNRNKNLRTEIIKVLSKNSYLFSLLYN